MRYQVVFADAAQIDPLTYVGLNSIPITRRLHIWESGWPFRSARCVSVVQSPLILPDEWRPAWVVDLGKFGSNQKILLPLQPIWTGFVLDSIFYGVLAWGLTRGIFIVRRWRRHCAARCVKCGYALSGLPANAPCPECGPLAARR